MLKQLLIYISCFTLFSCIPINSLFSPSLKNFKDPRDGENYKYIEIDDRYWMTSNMRYNVEGSKLNPNNPSSLYGRLYTWEQAMKACPKGWDLSTDGDWLSLEQYVIYDRSERLTERKYRGSNIKILKSKKDWPTPGTDSLKMNILPAGDFAFGKFTNLGTVAGFWTSSSHIMGGKLGEKFAYYRIIASNKEGIYYDSQQKDIYYSCRCVKNIENNPYLDA